MFSNRVLAIALLGAVAAAQADEGKTPLGKSCVNSQLTSLFTNVNEIREEATNSALYQDTLSLKYQNGDLSEEAVTADFTDSKFPLRQGNVDTSTVTHKEVSSNQKITDAVSVFTNLDGADMAPLTWSEGLALAAKEYADKWALDEADDAADVTRRVKRFGRLNSRAQLVESVFEFKAYHLDPTDLTRLVLTNDGSNNQLANALFNNNSKVTHFGASYAVTDGCYMAIKNQWADPPQETNFCDVVLVVIAANKFENNRDVPACQPTIDFGGGICNPDPSTQTEEIYKQLLRMRLLAYSEFRPFLQQIMNACLKEPRTWDFNGTTATACPADFSTKALKAINKIDSTMDDLGHLEWTPGLYMAAKAGAKALVNQPQEIIDQITQEKVYEYTNLDDWGETGQVTTGILLYGDNTPKNAVARMLIDDFDDTATEALLNTAVTQVGVSVEPSSTWTNIGAVILDSGFRTKGPYDKCKAPPPVVDCRQSKWQLHPKCRKSVTNCALAANRGNPECKGAMTIATALYVTVAALMAALY